MPGMAANEKIFNRISLDKNHYSLHYLKWLEPNNNETLKDYVLRLSACIKHKNIVLVGVSFGGIIVQELAKICTVKQLIIVSSIKSTHEKPKLFYWLQKLKIYKLLTKSNFDFYTFVLQKSPVKKHQKKAFFYNYFLDVRSTKYLQWAAKQVLDWKNENPQKNILHLHGNKDHIFPYKKCKNIQIINNGTHAMILLKALEINKILAKELL